MLFKFYRPVEKKLHLEMLDVSNETRLEVILGETKYANLPKCLVQEEVMILKVTKMWDN